MVIGIFSLVFYNDYSCFEVILLNLKKIIQLHKKVFVLICPGKIE